MSARSVVDVRLSIANYLEIDRVHFRKNDSCTTFMSIVNLSMFSLSALGYFPKAVQSYDGFFYRANVLRNFFLPFSDIFQRLPYPSVI